MLLYEAINLSRIIEIEQSYIEGTVYNFETESHTFMCKDALPELWDPALRVRGWA